MSDEVVAIETTPTAETSSIEAEARTQGWRPADEFHGRESDWVDAETFVQRGQQILPIVQASERRLRKEVERLKAEQVATRATVVEFANYHQTIQQRAYQQAMEDLKTKRHDAILAGEDEEVVRLEKQMEVVHQQSQQPTGPQVHQAVAADSEPAVVQEELQEWTENHAWFGKDRVKTNIAMAIGETIQEETSLKGRAFLRELDKRMVAQFPEQFQNTPRGGDRLEGPSSSGRGPASKSGRGFSQLPPEAQAACNKFVKQGLLTREQYCQEYDWN